MPPIPIIGTETLSLTSFTHFSATSLIAFPESPPDTFESNALPLISSVKTSGPTVLTAVIPSAPASTALFAISPALPTLGIIFAKMGRSVTSLTADTTWATRSGEAPIVAPYPSACGQERLSSIQSVYLSTLLASSANSSAVPPNMEVIRTLLSG